MGKGTPSQGKKGRSKTHIRCRRCGRRSYHTRQKKCAACGFGQSAQIRSYAWQNKKVNKVRLV